MDPHEQIAFDDDGDRIAAVDFDWDGVETETVETPSPSRDRTELVTETISIALEGRHEAREVGFRIMAIGYLLKLPTAPRTLGQLGQRMGISKQAAHKRLTGFKAELTKKLSRRGDLVDEISLVE